MKATKRISNLINDRHVMPHELATRFLIDGNLHSIRCIITDSDQDYAETEEITVTKNSGGFVITHKISRFEPFYGTETEVIKHSTHNVKSVKTLLNDLLTQGLTSIDIINQHGRYADINILKFAAK